MKKFLSLFLTYFIFIGDIFALAPKSIFKESPLPHTYTAPQRGSILTRILPFLNFLTVSGICPEEGNFYSTDIVPRDYFARSPSEPFKMFQYLNAYAQHTREGMSSARDIANNMLEPYRSYNIGMSYLPFDSFLAIDPFRSLNSTVSQSFIRYDDLQCHLDYLKFLYPQEFIIPTETGTGTGMGDSSSSTGTFTFTGMTGTLTGITGIAVQTLTSIGTGTTGTGQIGTGIAPSIVAVSAPWTNYLIYAGSAAGAIALMAIIVKKVCCSSKNMPKSEDVEMSITIDGYKPGDLRVGEVFDIAEETEDEPESLMDIEKQYQINPIYPSRIESESFLDEIEFLISEYNEIPALKDKTNKAIAEIRHLFADEAMTEKDVFEYRLYLKFENLFDRLNHIKFGQSVMDIRKSNSNIIGWFNSLSALDLKIAEYSNGDEEYRRNTMIECIEELRESA